MECVGEPRIILYDLETAPSLAQVMRVFPQLSNYPGQTLKASINSIICFGYQIFGEQKVNCINAWDYDDWLKDANNDYEIVKRAREVLVEADCVVTHNGKRFDHKFLQTRLMYHGFKPLPRMLHIDTCQVAKSHLLMFNNKLNTIAKFMTNEEKLENGGWDLWDRVMKREQKAMDLMTKYCKQDVRTLNEVFKKFLPLISNLPNYNMYASHDRPACASCGSTRIQKRGQMVSKNAIKQRYTCQDCGSSMSEHKKHGLQNER